MKQEEKPQTVVAFDSGYEAFAEGYSKKDNPYDATSELHNKWIFGWEMAQDDRREYLGSIDPLGGDY